MRGFEQVLSGAAVGGDVDDRPDAWLVVGRLQAGRGGFGHRRERVQGVRGGHVESVGGRAEDRRRMQHRRVETGGGGQLRVQTGEMRRVL